MIRSMSGNKIINDMELLSTYINEYNLDDDVTKFLSNLKKLSIDIDESKYSKTMRNQIGFKVDRDINDPTDPVNQFITKLSNIQPINKNHDILYNDTFIQYFYIIFWNIIQGLGISTQNFYQFIQPIIDNLNNITTDDYVIYDCRSTDNYNCGRAMDIINIYPSKFLIFNTDDQAYFDMNVQTLYLDHHINQDNNVINDLTGLYPRMHKRISKELSILSDDY